MSPGSVMELLYFFIAGYSKDRKINEGGGVEHEEENIRDSREIIKLPV
jgi:hypothetical protein